MEKTLDAMDCPDETADFVANVSRTEAQIIRFIEGLSISADAKALLVDLLKVSTKVGKKMLRIGRKMLDFVLSLVKLFPALTFAALLALVVGSLISMVPLIGSALSVILGPLAMVLGISWGAWQDLRNGDLGLRVDEFIANFKSLMA